MTWDSVSLIKLYSMRSVLFLTIALAGASFDQPESAHDFVIPEPIGDNDSLQRENKELDAAHEEVEELPTELVQAQKSLWTTDKWCRHLRVKTKLMAEKYNRHFQYAKRFCRVVTDKKYADRTHIAHPRHCTQTKVLMAKQRQEYSAVYKAFMRDCQ